MADIEIRRHTGSPAPDAGDDALGSDEARGMALVQPSDMPSKFLPYPDGVRIFYRPYTFDEITTFSQSMVDMDERLRFVMQGILVKGMDKMRLTVSDWMYLGLLRKISSFGTESFTVTVPADAEQGRLAHTARIPVSRISVTDLSVPALPAVMVLDGTESTFSPLDVGRFMDLMHKLRAELRAEMAEKMAAAGGGALNVDNLPVDESEMREPTTSELMAYQCTSSDPGDVLPKVKAATRSELLDLQDMDAAFYHRTDPVRLEWKQKDGKEFSETVWIDDPTSLVWPFRGPDKPDGSTLRFGL